MPDDGPEPIDPDFAGLFRRDPPGPTLSPPSSAPSAEPAVGGVPPVASEPEESPGSPEPPASPEPDAPDATSAPAADTGRLFRSQGAAGHDEAVLALSSDHFGRLRTLKRDDGSTPSRARSNDAVAPMEPSPTGVDQPVPAAVAPSPVGYAAGTDIPDGPLVVPASTTADEEDPTSARRTRRSGGHRTRAISAGAGYLIVIGLTVIVGFVNALVTDGELGWPTGLALLISSVYVALTIRLDDASVAVIVPPVAFALTALTAGQVFLGASANSLLNRAVVWFFALADNWPWIIGSTVVALVIVLVRRRLR